MEQRIFDAIKEAEMILVGIGEEFSPVWNDFLDQPERAEGQNTSKKDRKQEGWQAVAQRKEGESTLLGECRRSRFYEEIPKEHAVLAAYDRLREWIGSKPYFIVTMNTDDLIYRSSLENDLIVAPCGSYGKMQCGEHIVLAGEIRDAVLAARDERLAVCPECGRPLCFHTASHQGYMESGYLPQWEAYTKWLSCTLNRKLCILELGVGFTYPQIVRFAFEKTAYFNKKATLIRIHSRFPQLAQELAQSGIAVRENPVDFMLRHKTV